MKVGRRLLDGGRYGGSVYEEGEAERMKDDE